MKNNKSKNDWKKKRKISYLNKRKYRYYIFCEGEETEPNYFMGFKRLIDDNPIYRNMVLVEIQPCGAETLRVIYQAEKYVKDNEIEKGQVWCVYDKDSFPAEHFNGVSERAEALNKINSNIKYKVAWSNECVEFWFILHFANYTSNNSRTEYKKFLNKKFNGFGLGNYEKNREDIFEILQEYGNEKLAIRYAKKIIDANVGLTPTEIAPGTKVYELVEELRKYCIKKK